MSKVIDAIYEGHGMVRLNHEPKGLRPNDHVTVFIIPSPQNTTISVENAGMRGLRQQLIEFEAQYSWDTSEFYSRFLRGETTDERDFVVWAGLYELLLRSGGRHQPVIAGD